MLFFLSLDPPTEKKPPEDGRFPDEERLLTVPLDFNAGEEVETTETEGMQRD